MTASSKQSLHRHGTTFLEQGSANRRNAVDVLGGLSPYQPSLE
jgi:hypothetical protein